MKQIAFLVGLAATTAANGVSAMAQAEFNELAQRCAPWVAAETMAAIARTESNFNPLAIGVNGGERLERMPTTKAEAVITAKFLLAQGHNIDVGLTQINSTNFEKVRLTVEDLFDPCKNLAAGATILQWNFAQASTQEKDPQAALHKAFSIYNTGSSTKGFQNGYVQKVLDSAIALQQPPTVPAVQPIPLVRSAGSQPAATAAHAPAQQPIQSRPEDVFNSGSASLPQDSADVKPEAERSPYVFDQQQNSDKVKVF